MVYSTVHRGVLIISLSLSHSLTLSLSLSLPQLSKLTLQSQTVPFHCDDVAVTTAGRVSPSNQHESLLAHYQEELGEVRTELDQKLHEVEALHGELALLRGEHEGTRKELDDQRRMLQVTHQQRNELDQEVPTCI